MFKGKIRCFQNGPTSTNLWIKVEILWQNPLQKVKQSLYRPVTGPEGSRRLTLTDF